jgi:type II secretory pathway predicted ATPase ExeA
LQSSSNKAELLIQLNQYLIGQYRRGSTTVLVVDEGQLLEWEVLEEIRLLTNLETVQQKLLQIILVGQPELELKLDSPRLRQLKQRITFRCRLRALSQPETQAYIIHRLEVAGASSRAAGLFPEATIYAIAQHTHGVPRLINTICENALIEGYARQIHEITPEMIHQIAADSRLDSSQHPELIGNSFDRDELVNDVLKEIEAPDAGDAKEVTG